jgi:hypothetical protein
MASLFRQRFHAPSPTQTGEIAMAYDFQHRSQDTRRTMAEQLMEKLPPEDTFDMSVIFQPPRRAPQTD